MERWEWMGGCWIFKEGKKKLRRALPLQNDELDELQSVYY